MRRLKLGAYLFKSGNRMSSGCYFAPTEKVLPIPKKSRDVRVLGIPTVSCKRVIIPIDQRLHCAPRVAIGRARYRLSTQMPEESDSS
jgi:hypothetical protein